MSHEAPALRACLLDLLAQRSPEASICPSEVARSMAPAQDAWRALMEPVRHQAQQLAREGVIVITQGAHSLDPEGPFNGPIRLRRGPGF